MILSLNIYANFWSNLSLLDTVGSTAKREIPDWIARIRKPIQVGVVRKWISSPLCAVVYFVGVTYRRGSENLRHKVESSEWHFFSSEKYSCFSYFSTKTYVVGTHERRLVKALLMSTNNIMFSFRKKKSFTWISFLSGDIKNNNNKKRMLNKCMLRVQQHTCNITELEDNRQFITKTCLYNFDPLNPTFIYM